MKETMEAVAVRANEVATKLLPRSPLHLTLGFDSHRFPNADGDNFWFQGASAPLQYMTYIAIGERGLLVPRARWDISDEADTTPTPMSLKTLAKENGTKKKMTFKDYQKRKKSTSPADNDAAAKAGNAKQNGVAEQRPKDVGNKDEEKLKESASLRKEACEEKPRQGVNGERKRHTQSRPESQKHPPSSENRKRDAESEETGPRQKRLKSGLAAPKNYQPESDTSRHRDGALGRGADKELAKGRPNQPMTNGRVSKVTKERDSGKRTPSPVSCNRVNGSKARVESASSTPKIWEKKTVPALLSPLHPSFEREIDEQNRQKRKSLGKQPAKGDDLERGPPKKQKTSLEIPKLLSPTLPPILEQEVAARMKPHVGFSLGQASNQATDSPGSAKKRLAEHLDNAAEEPHPPVKNYLFKLKKANIKRLKKLLNLPSKSAKDGLKKDRSASTEPLVKKRPRVVVEVAFEHSASKRPRPVAETLARQVPSTPLKQGASMSRVASSQSHADTPGNAQKLTPGERAQAASESVDPAKCRPLLDRFEEYRVLGSRLKHNRDDLVKGKGGPLAPADDMRAAALHFEMILAYFVSFGCANRLRILGHNKLSEPFILWESLVPHFHELRRRVRSRELAGLASQMHAMCLEQITHAYAFLPSTNAAALLSRFREHERARVPQWADAMKRSANIKNADMKTLIGPWISIDETVSAALAIMNRWADRERVKWTPEVLRGGRETGAGGHDHHTRAT